MKLFKVSALFLLAGAAAACSHDVSGNLVTPDSLAGLRYVNLVPDVGAIDFRIIDVVSGAPNQVAAAFRTGGSPEGVSTGGFLPLQQPVAAGTRHIRIFLNGNNPTTSSTIVFDTTATFASGKNYSFYLYGSWNAGTGADTVHGSPTVHALVTLDTTGNIAGNNFAVRVLDLAPNITGNPAGVPNGNLDGRVALAGATLPLAVAASFTNLAPPTLTPYVTFPISAAGTAYRLAVTATGTATPIAFQGVMPVGTAGNATTQPVPGTAVAGTAFTALIVPQSVVGSGAPQTAAAVVNTNIDSVTRISDTAVVWRKVNAATATACASPVAAGAAANDMLNVSGVTQPEYNGSVAVASVVAGTAQTLWSQKTITLTGATGGFTLTFGGATTGVLAPTATAAQVEAALGGLSTIGAANVSVSGAAGGPYTVLFMGTFTNTTVGTLSGSANGGLTVGIANAAVGCGTAALVTRDTIAFTGTVAGDSFKVTVGNASTPFMSTSATAGKVDTTIAALSTVGAVANVTVTTTASGYVVSFVGAQNNNNVAASAAMKAGSVGTVAVAKAGYVFSGAATPSRIKYRIPSSSATTPATGALSFKVVTSGTADFTAPTVLYMIDILPPRTAP